MGRFRAATLLLVALAAGFLVAGCGGGGNADLLPGTTADQINSNLDLVRESVNEGNCEEAEITVAEVSEEVDNLKQVDAKLKNALEQGAAKLSELVGGCGAGQEAEEEERAEEAAAAEQKRIESEEREAAETEEEEAEQREEEEPEEKAQEKAEKHAEQPGPPEEGEESGPPGKTKGHEEQEETEPPTEEGGEVTPPAAGPGPAGGIGPGAAVGEGEG
jgi:hypothetical protein